MNRNNDAYIADVIAMTMDLKRSFVLLCLESILNILVNNIY